ncbi:hypothetical protein GWK47_039020 [Chionoecetes opilio]|uniref:Uncharacterized protein n=1 Tax=Chionoecetes opilio TaxID=41210 RepID=A0A8J4YKJ8_CHIOP|nr:hypothetical protein GWK47_039020 [Chionoecetes opilio]
MKTRDVGGEIDVFCESQKPSTVGNCLWARGASPRPPYDATAGGHHAARDPLQAPFPYQAALDKKTSTQLAPAPSLVGALLASSTPGCLLQMQPDGKDRFQGSVPHAHIAGVGADGLCR